MFFFYQIHMSNVQQLNKVLGAQVFVLQWFLQYYHQSTSPYCESSFPVECQSFVLLESHLC